MTHRRIPGLRLLCGGILIVLSSSGCLLTKLVTVPMRVGGAVLSVVPIAGDAAHGAIDEAAEIVDEIPL